MRKIRYRQQPTVELEVTDDEYEVLASQGLLHEEPAPETAQAVVTAQPKPATIQAAAPAGKES